MPVHVTVIRAKHKINFSMAKVLKKGSVQKVHEVIGVYKRSESNPSIFENDSTGMALLIKDAPRRKTIVHPAAQLLVKAQGETSFYHLSGLWQVLAGRNEYRISDKTTEKPKGCGIVTYDMFQLTVKMQRA